MTIPPQVIKRGDDYVIHNVDLTGLTVTQRLAYAVEVWPQIRTLMEQNGEFKPPDRTSIGQSGGGGFGGYEVIDRAAGKATASAHTSVALLRPRMLEQPDILQKAKDGEFDSLRELGIALGKKMRLRLDEGAPSRARLKTSYYGKGDKFTEATEPLIRYLTAWEKKDFKYPHVPPKEAKRRLAKIEEILGGLEQVKEDILMRSHAATFKVRS